MSSFIVISFCWLTLFLCIAATKNEEDNKKAIENNPHVEVVMKKKLINRYKLLLFTDKERFFNVKND